MNRVFALVVSVALVGFGFGCDGGSAMPPAPRLVPGGGIGDGAISGLLNVYVTDDDTRQPVAGATVRVGGSADPAACSATTDSTGLVVFEQATCTILRGKQSLTASAAGYAPSTWIGANGTNMTMGIRAVRRPAIDTATVSGTIQGWSDLAAPAPNHNTLGLVSFSQTRDLGDRQNEIVQGTRTVTVPVLGGFPVPANVCVTTAQVSDCNFRLTTRTGAQALFAIIVDQDTKGTTVEADDTFTVIGFALKTGLTFAKDQVAGGETLPQLADTDMQPMTVAFGGPPAGLDQLDAIALLDLGSQGRIAMGLQSLDATHTMSRVPKLSGALSGAHYDLLAQARDAADSPDPSTAAWLHGVNPTGTVDVTGWLQPPTGITSAGGTYSFQPVAGATLHSAEIQTIAGERAWAITVFDGSTSFTLPGLASDPLPASMAILQVTALQIPGIDLSTIAFDEAQDRLTGIASDQIKFTR